MKTVKRIILFSFLLLVLLCSQRQNTIAIHNGTSANGQFPWMVGLAVENTDGSVEHPFCGGVLIHPEWVLTTHHCFKYNDDGELKGEFITSGDPDITQYVALIGGEKLRTFSNEKISFSGWPVTYSGNEVYSPPDVDLALWRLSNPSQNQTLSFGSIESVASISSTNGSFTTMGYGDVNLVMPSNDLLKISFSNTEINSYQLKAFVENGESICGRDSGSPTIYDMNGVPYLAALAQGGDNFCGFVSEMYFQLVPQYVSWIHRTIDSNTQSNCVENSVSNHSSDRLRLFDQTHCYGGVWSTNQLNQEISIGNFSPYSMDIQPGYSVIVYNPQSPPSMSACYSGDLWNMNKDYYPGSHTSIANNIGSIKLISGSCSSSAPDAPPPPDTAPLPPGPQTGTGGGVLFFEHPNYEGKLLYTFNEGFSNAPNAEGYSMRIPDGWSVVTYREDNMGGMSECWNSDVPNFQDHNDWQTKTQSIQIYDWNVCVTDPPDPYIAPNILFFGENNYISPGKSFYTGFHDREFFNAKSFEIKSGSSVVLYRWDKRQSVNRAHCFNSSVPNLAEAGWNYEIAGVEVFGHDICQDTLSPTQDYLFFLDEGQVNTSCGGTGEVAVANLSNWCGRNWNDQLSSFRVKNGWSVKFWEHANFEGGSRCFSYGRTTLRNDAFNNGVSIAIYPGNGELDSQISSFAVFENEYCDGSPKMPEAAWGYSVDNDGDFALSEFVISADENNNQSITVEWEASSDPSTLGYRIYEHLDDDEYELLAEVDSYTTLWRYNGLPCGTEYHFLVKAFNQWGDSATPNLVSVETPACFVPPTTPNAPNAPTNLRVTNSTTNSMSVSWVDNSTDESVFEVWYRSIEGSWNNPSVGANIASYDISGLSCETEYDVVVRAVKWVDGTAYFSESNWINPSTLSCDEEPVQDVFVYLPTVMQNSTGNTNPSPPTEGPIPNNPTDLRLIGTGHGSFSVSWNDNSNIEDVYEVWYRNESGIWINPVLPANTTNHTVTGVTCFSYDVMVRAVRRANGELYYSDSNFIVAPVNQCN